MADETTVDLTSDFADAVLMRHGWSPDHARALANLLANSIPHGWVDWDDESGEEWARVSTERFVVAMVRVNIPLVVIVRSEMHQLRQFGFEVKAIAVPEMNTPCLSAAPEAMEQAFPERQMSPNLDPTTFSAMDLWFATT